MGHAPITLFFVALTCIVSFMAFQREDLINKLILWPQKMDSPAEYYRILSSGFIHQDLTHLAFNMFTLYFMGSYVEGYFSVILGKPLLYVALYLAGIAVASLPSYLKNRSNPRYRSLGASGGVAAVIFASVYFSPFGMLYVFFIEMYNIIFAVLYLAYTIYMSRKGNDNINHDAHLWGAIFGFAFTLAVSPDHGQRFIEQIQNWHL